ncbi:MAG: type II toxin-antitoxin system HicB family antitoxin [Anaerolineae bacterium]|nr:type II toxin-antitoxin system HicB family antitoxin [Anaerolineae bacterium]
MSAIYKLPLVLEPQPEGGFTVTCPLLPELITEGDTVEQALNNVSDALAAVIEAYEHLGKPIPPALQHAVATAPLWIETAVTVP